MVHMATSGMTFPGYDKEALAFLRQLKSNNRRDWFLENKNAYEKLIREPTKILAFELSDRLQELTGEPQKPKIFRINRDLRFAKDKTPYNTHVHISLLRQSGIAPAFMLGWSPEYLSFGCGIFEFSKDVRPKYRSFVASNEGKKLQVALDELAASGTRLDVPALKRVPSGYDADHPRADLLRHKGIAVWQELDDPSQVADQQLVEKAMVRFEAFLPVYKLIAAL